MKDFVPVGFGNLVLKNRIVMIITPDSQASKRLREKARKSDMLVDLTMGRKTRAVIVLDSGHVVLSAINTNTIAQRTDGDRYKED